MSKVIRSNDKTDNSLFHAGEKEMQTRVGKRDEMEILGRFAITKEMSPQHRNFYSQLPFFVIGSVDKKKWPWASIVTGKPGFLTSPDLKTLCLNTSVLEADPLTESMKIGSPLGMLGIELSTRRRNRVNTRVSNINETGFSVTVDQAFGNCPQYIQTRSVDFIREPHLINHQQNSVDKVPTFTDFDDDMTAMIKTADTFFVSSFVPTKDNARIEGVDVSHRGGVAGFVKVEGNTLTIPDFSGNNLFNTLGNFLLNPKAGLTFIDFKTGDLLMLTGTVEILDETDKDIASFKDVQRGWRFTLDHGLKLFDVLPFRSTFREYSPTSLMAGNWADVEENITAQNSVIQAKYQKAFAEVFGPTGLKKSKVKIEDDPVLKKIESRMVKFTQSDLEKKWKQGDGTLLEMAESQGLSPRFGCRKGVCGGCSVKLKSGSVAYLQPPKGLTNEGEVLICCAVPAKGEDTVEIEL